MEAGCIPRSGIRQDIFFFASSGTAILVVPTSLISTVVVRMGYFPLQVNATSGEATLTVNYPTGAIVIGQGSASWISHNRRHEEASNFAGLTKDLFEIVFHLTH